MKKDNKQISKFLSLVLRHKPTKINLELDQFGWAHTSELIYGLKQSGFNVSLEQLKEIVATSDKKRFRMNDDFTKIKANQGHSISIEFDFTERKPTEMLYHGTAKSNIEAIKKEGLQKQQRHHVHLSIDPETAKKVGMRYGKPEVLKIDSLTMYNDGKIFYISENGVWLTDEVLPKYILNFIE